MIVVSKCRESWDILRFTQQVVGTDYAQFLIRVCLVSEESKCYHPRMSSMPRVLFYSRFFNITWVEQLKITYKPHFLMRRKLHQPSIIPEMLDGSLSVVHSFSQQMCIKYLSCLGTVGRGLGSGQDETVTGHTSINTLYQGKTGKTKTKKVTLLYA